MNRFRDKSEKSSDNPDQEIFSDSSVIKIELEKLFEKKDEYPLFFNPYEASVFSDNPKEFVKSINEIVLEKRDTDQDKVEDFLENIQKTFFSSSENILTGLNPRDLFQCVIELNRVEEVRAFIGQTSIVDLVYLLRFGNADYLYNEIIDYIDSLGFGYKEEAIHQLESVFMQSVANGDWASGSKILTKKIIEDLVASDHVLTSTVAQVALERCNEEEIEPSRGFIHMEVDAGAGRLDSYADVVSLVDRVDSNLPTRFKPVVISKDVVVGMDHAGMPRFGACIENAPKFLEAKDTGIGILKALSEIDLPYISQSNILKLLNMFASYRSYFGESGESVVSFYSKIFDMGEAEMDIFINNGENVVPLFKRDWKKIQPRIVEIARRKLDEVRKRGIERIDFLPVDELSSRQDMNPFSSFGEGDSLLLAQCLRPEVRGKLQDDLGIDFNQISFRAEISLFKFLSNETKDTYSRLIELLNENPDKKLEIIESLVGCAIDIEFGEEFISICENSIGNELNVFLEIYSGIVLNYKKLEELIRVDQENKNVTPELAGKYTQVALRKAKDFVAFWNDGVSSARKSDQTADGGLKGEFVLDKSELEDYKDRAVQSSVFTSLFFEARSIYNEKVFEALDGFGTKLASELTEQELNGVREMYRKNYEATHPELCEKLIDIFDQRIKKEGVKCYLLKDKDKVVSFLTLEPHSRNGVDNGTDKVVNKGAGEGAQESAGGEDLYFASFNTDKDYQGASIGVLMMERVLGEYSREHAIYADCAAYSPVAPKYIEDGFIANKFYMYANNPSLEIVLDKKKEYKTKALGTDEIMSEYVRAELGGEISTDGILEKEDYLIIRKDRQEDIDMNRLGRQGESWVLTRYFPNRTGPKQSGTAQNSQSWYAVFERV